MCVIYIENSKIAKFVAIHLQPVVYWTNFTLITTTNSVEFKTIVIKMIQRVKVIGNKHKSMENNECIL